MTLEAARSISLIPQVAFVPARVFVAFDANGHIQPAPNGDAVGVSLEASPDGMQSPIPIAPLDGAKLEVVAGAAVLPGVPVTADAQGRAIALVPGTTATARGLAYAITRADAAGEVLDVVSSKVAEYSQRV